MHCRRIVHPLIPAATKKRLFVMRSVEVCRWTCQHQQIQDNQKPFLCLLLPNLRPDR